MEEVWKNIDKDGWYEVSDMGRVRSWKRQGPGDRRRSEPRLMKLGQCGGDGYVPVCLHVDGRQSTRSVHQLVLEAFVGPLPVGGLTRHLDGNKANNRLENLRYGTPKENSADMVVHGTLRFGENSNASKLTDAQVREMRRLRREERLSYLKLGPMFGVTYRQASNICRNLAWSHVD